MTNDPKRVRALLEPHGYEFSRLKNVGIRKSHTFNARKPALDDCYECGPRGFHSTRMREGEEVEDALSHFLNDRGQTGARIASNPDQFRLDCCDLAEEIALGGDPNDVFADWWLRVHALEDPRKEASG